MKKKMWLASLIAMSSLLSLPGVEASASLAEDSPQNPSMSGAASAANPAGRSSAAASDPANRSASASDSAGRSASIANANASANASANMSANANPIANASINSSAKANYFLIQTAQQGRIELANPKTAANQQPGNAAPAATANKPIYTIILKNITPYVSYFADRPNRNAGQMGIQEYLKLWLHQTKNSFKINPPNAILHAVNSVQNAANSDAPAGSPIQQASNSKQPMYFAVEISNPRYDSATQTLTYQAKPLSGFINPLPNAATLNHVTLFIDDVCIGCWDD